MVVWSSTKSYYSALLNGIASQSNFRGFLLFYWLVLCIYCILVDDYYLDFYGLHCAGIEARGFIFGPPIALAIGAKFVPMRKPNKLPGMLIIPFFFFCPFPS